MKQYIANKMRRWADRLDRAGAPKRTHLSFTFEDYKGLVVNTSGVGCHLWYLNDAEYDKAHTEAGGIKSMSDVFAVVTSRPDSAYAKAIRDYGRQVVTEADTPRTLIDSGPTSGECLRFESFMVPKHRAHLGDCQTQQVGEQ